MKVYAKDWRNKQIEVYPNDVDLNGNSPIPLNMIWCEEFGVDHEIIELGDGYYDYKGHEIQYVHELQMILING